MSSYFDYDYIVSFVPTSLWNADSVTTLPDDIYREQQPSAATSANIDEEWTLVSAIRDDITDDIVVVQSTQQVVVQSTQHIVHEIKGKDKDQREMEKLRAYKRLPRSISGNVPRKHLRTGKLLTLRDRQTSMRCTRKRNERQMVVYSRGLAKVPELKLCTDAEMSNIFLQSKPLLKYFIDLEIKPSQDSTTGCKLLTYYYHYTYS
jgi:hypothetical protein